MNNNRNKEILLQFSLNHIFFSMGCTFRFPNSKFQFRCLSFLYAICFISLRSSTIIAAEYPELPRVYIHTPYNLPTSGQIISVSSSAAFQAALNSAQPGDIIELQAGTTFTGPFTLPNKTSGTEWIYIRSSKYSALPAPCSRVSPADAANMPKIVVTSGNKSLPLKVCQADRTIRTGLTADGKTIG